jgi:heme/copper-type cytochrome/quinol oxidase subunit 2
MKTKSIPAPVRFSVFLSRVVPFSILSSLLFLGVGCQKAEAPSQRISVVMKKYDIQPGVIRVKAGEPVELDVTTADVQHGLDVPDLGIKESVQPGRTTKINFTPKTKGEFKVVCGVICGPHHEDMVGKLVVE